jgi:hypothetical protein
MAALGIPVKAIAFGAVAVIAGLLMFSRSAKADVPTPPPPLPPKNTNPPLDPPKAKPTCLPGEEWDSDLKLCTDWKDPCVGGVGDGVKMTIKTAQQALSKALAKKLSVDGDYGPETKKALVEFQTNAGIEKSGCLDMATATLLQPYVVVTTGLWEFMEDYSDQNDADWRLDRNEAGTWRASQLPYQLANGTTTKAYPDEPSVMYAPTRVEIVRAIVFVAQDYEIQVPAASV